MTTDITGQLLADIRDEIRGTNKRIDQVVTRLDSHDRILLRMADELGGVNGRLDRVEGRLDHMEGRLDHMEGRLDHMDGRLDRVEGHLDRLERRVGGLEHEQRVTNARLGALVEVITLAVDQDSRLDAAIQDLRHRVEQLERR